MALSQLNRNTVEAILFYERDEMLFRCYNDCDSQSLQVIVS